MRSVRPAFTLIETLVVVSTIVLLISIMLPALGKSREHARAVICGTQLSQIGYAAQMYRDANKDFFTPKALKTMQTVFAWVGRKGAGGYANLTAADRYLNPYLGGPFDPDADVPIARCPGDPYLYTPSAGSSYGSNHHPSHNSLVRTDNITPIRFYEVRQPGRLVLGAEHGANHYAWNETHLIGANNVFWHWRGELKWNLLFVDGHVTACHVNVGAISGPDYDYRK